MYSLRVCLLGMGGCCVGGTGGTGVTGGYVGGEMGVSGVVIGGDGGGGTGVGGGGCGGGMFKGLAVVKLRSIEPRLRTTT